VPNHLSMKVYGRSEGKNSMYLVLEWSTSCSVHFYSEEELTVLIANHVMMTGCGTSV
jgi:hypothetical protein